MGDRTKIPYCDATANFWYGRTKVSPACNSCFAEDVATRFNKARWGPGEPRVRIEGANATLAKVARRARREGHRLRVLLQDLGDFCDPEVPAIWKQEAWAVMRAAPELDCLLLTKRPEHLPGSLPDDWGAGWPNVMLGVTAENQEWLERRWPLLLAIPSAAGYWVSYEPALGPADFAPYAGGLGIALVVVGGESGSNARPFDLGWARATIAQCGCVGAAAYVKQLGSLWARESAKDRGEPWRAGDAGSDPALWPHDIRVRQIPPAFDHRPIKGVAP